MAYRKRNSVISDILSKQEVDALLQMHKEGFMIKDIAIRFNVHRNTVTNIINRDKLRRQRLQDNY